MLLANAVRTSAGVEQAFDLADYYAIFLFLGLQSHLSSAHYSPRSLRTAWASSHSKQPR